jgi:hypothetical protein
VYRSAAVVDAFLGYRGYPGLHDGVVVSVDRAGDRVVVLVRASNGRRLAVEFSGVQTPKAHRPSCRDEPLRAR